MNAAPHIVASPALVTLDDYAFLVLEGERVLQLLQGQLTCDVRQATADRVIEGAYCNPKGRVISNFLLWAPESHRVSLRMRVDIVATTAAVLSRYAALSRVHLQPGTHVCTGLLGQGLAETAGALLGQWPAQRLQIVSAGAHRVLQCDEAGLRYEIWSPAESAAALREALGGYCESSPPARWDLALLRERKVDIVARTSNEFLPQMLEYDRGDAVSFRKGCYTGQEIIARAHYKGALKRRLHHLATNATHCPEPGETLFRDDGSRPVGSIVASARNEEGRIEALAVLAEDATSGLHDANGSTYGLLTDPCAILD